MPSRKGLSKRTEQGESGIRRCASPTNLPVQINPPKPARVVAAEGMNKFPSANSSQDTKKRRGSGLDLSGSKAKRYQRDGKAIQFSDLLIECKLLIFSYLINENSFTQGPWAVSKEWHQLCRNHRLWREVPSFTSSGQVNPFAFKYLGLKNQGTEGTCFKVYHRRSGKIFAMKRARVYPTGEGVPYYMLRELAFLRGLSHPHIATVERISLVDNQLYLFFNYTEKSLFDLINPNNDANGGIPLPHTLIKRFMFQILQGVAFCHQRGVLHRNLKPKHLLIDIPALNSEQRCIPVNEERSKLAELMGVSTANAKNDEEDAQESAKVSSSSKTSSTDAGGTEALSADCENKRQVGMEQIIMNPTEEPASGQQNTLKPVPAMDKEVYSKLLEAAEHGTLRISDFALVRSTSVPLRKYTTEVVTLWYRSPEVLMGGQYFAAVDVWSVGCVFAEMILGKPLFPGICEVGQLFQIFLKLGTPTAESWPGFTSLPNYSFSFPNWRKRPLSKHIRTPDGRKLEPAGLDLMSKMLTVNPDHRITAEEAVNHPYFDSIRDSCSPTADPAPESSTLRRSASATIPLLNTIDPDFEQPPYEPGRLDLNDMCWSCPEQEPISATSAWKYSKKLHEIVNAKKRTQQGLEDPMYLVRYYHYLKVLEKGMYPLRSYMSTTGLNAPGNNTNSSSSSSSSSNSRERLNEATVSEGSAMVQADLLPIHRAMLVDWLVEVIDVFEMSVRSVFTAVNYTDRHLALRTVERKQFQLLGATCLHIASKCEDVSYIGVEDLVVCADRVYEEQDVLKLEEEVLNTLDFRICVPTVIDFLNIFIVRLGFGEEEDEMCTELAPGDKHLARIDVSKKARILSQYMAELSLQEYFFMWKMPSEVAAAALVLALYYTDAVTSFFPYEERLIATTGYSLADIRESVEQLKEAHIEAPLKHTLTVIKRRYQRDVLCKVAFIEPKTNLSGLYPETG